MKCSTVKLYLGKFTGYIKSGEVAGQYSFNHKQEQEKMRVRKEQAEHQGREVARTRREGR